MAADSAANAANSPNEANDESSLLNLPVELLIKLPNYLHDIEDFMNVSSSCRTLHNLYSTTSPNLIFQLAAAASRVFFRPSPHLLIAAVARQVGEWALQSPDNRTAFHDSFKTEGIEGLFKLCIKVGRLSMPQVRNLYEFKLSVLNPLTEQLSRECGPLSTDALPRAEAPNEEYWTICEDPDISLLQVAIFADLFASSIKAVYNPQVVNPLSPRIRRDFWAQCCPDINCPESPKGGDNGEPCNLEMLSMHTMLISDFWRQGWQDVYEEFDDPFPFHGNPDPAIEFEEEMKINIWEQTVKGQGLEGLRLLRPGGVEMFRPVLEDAREKILAMDVGKLGDIEDRESEHTWSVRVSAVSDIYVCIGWA